MPALTDGADQIGRTALYGQDAAGNPVRIGSVFKVTGGFLAQGQTAKQYVGKQITSTTVATTVPLETVTAGKTYYITDIIISTDAASGAATTVDLRLQAAGVDIFREGVHNLSPIAAQGLKMPPFATSGQSVTLLLPITNPAVNVWFDILGIEQ